MKTDIGVLYMNARSIKNKISELCLIVHDEKPDVILISETWLSSEFDDSSLLLD